MPARVGDVRQGRAELLLAGLLLPSNSLTGTLPGAGVGVRALAAHRKAAAMTNPLVAADLNLAANVRGDFAAQVPLDPVICLDPFPELQQIVVRQIPDPQIGADAGGSERLQRAGTTDAIDVRERDLQPLVARKIDTDETGHLCSLPLTLLVPQILANHHDPAVSPDHLALVTNLFDARLNLHRISCALLRPTPRRSTVAVDDPAAIEVIGTQLDDHPVTRQDANVVHPHLAADVGEDLVAVGQLDPEHRVGQRLDHLALDLDDPVLLCHVLRVPCASPAGPASAVPLTDARHRTQGTFRREPPGQDTQRGGPSRKFTRDSGGL